MKLQSLILIIQKQICQDWNINKDIEVVEFIFFFMKISKKDSLLKKIIIPNTYSTILLKIILKNVLYDIFIIRCIIRWKLLLK